MNADRILDKAIKTPNKDLFGMDIYAEKLADFLSDPQRPLAKPFTIGVYGQWGQGKTSFVHLVKHYLTLSYSKQKQHENRTQDDLFHFIEFSAWPFSDTDTLWKALILGIAQDLYGIDPKGENGQKQGGSSTESKSKKKGFLSRLRQFLQKDALVFHTPPPEANPNQPYYDLLNSLHETTFGSVSRNPENQAQLNQEVALVSLVKAGLEVMSQVSPLVASIKKLFGIKTELEFKEMFDQNQSQTTEEKVKAIDNFNDVINQMFKTQAKDKGKEVFVFIDDLDRCLPDVALDILEALKVFMKSVNCVFIVAADRSLIGQGIRMRYKNVLQNANADISEVLEIKGQEYFEKIIQFNINVPPRSEEQTQKFIAAQFPRWTICSDIIYAGIESNPRRIKQLCNKLNYQYLVYEEKVERERERDIQNRDSNGQS